MGRKKKNKKKNKKKQGEKMAAGFITSTYNKIVKKVPRPDEYVRYDKINIVLHKQSDIEEVVAKSLESDAATSNEFQFHYWALQLIANAPNSEKSFVITLPLVYFNFKQKVSGAHIDFHLDDVREVSEKVEPVAHEKAKEVLKLISPLYQYFKNQGYEVSVKIGEVGSVHRHPGAFGFSATDLKNDPEHPGVIFRNRKAKDLYQVDSVLYLPRGNSTTYYSKYYSRHKNVSKKDSAKGAYLFTTECRFVNVEPIDDNDETKGITGSYDRIPTVLAWKKSTADVSYDEQAVALLESFLGIHQETAINTDIELKTDKIILSKNTDTYNTLIKMVEPLFAYETVKVIVPEFITEAYRYGRSFYNTSSYNKTAVSNKVTHNASKKSSEFDEFDDWYDYYTRWNDDDDEEENIDVVVDDDQIGEEIVVEKRYSEGANASLFKKTEEKK